MVIINELYFFSFLKKISQGDQERKLGLSISYLCDRNTVNTAKSQLGFIDIIVSPVF